MSYMGNKIRTRNISSGDLVSCYLDIDQYKLNRADYTHLNLKLSDIKTEINKNIIRPRFRICMLNSDETIKNIIPNEDIILGGQYTENYQNGQRRSISISLYNEQGKYTPSINGLWEGKKMSLELGIEIQDNIIIWFPK